MGDVLNVTYRYHSDFVPEWIAFDGVIVPRIEPGGEHEVSCEQKITEATEPSSLRYLLFKTYFCITGVSLFGEPQDKGFGLRATALSAITNPTMAKNFHGPTNQQGHRKDNECLMMRTGRLLRTIRFMSLNSLISSSRVGPTFSTSGSRVGYFCHFHPSRI